MNYKIHVLIGLLSLLIGVAYFTLEPILSKVNETSPNFKGEKSNSLKAYSLELKRWNIYNDGTHPKETTRGLNEAIKWASKKGFEIFKVPAGIYLISNGEPDDPNRRINMVSDLTFWLEEGAVLQKETNGYEGYELLYIGPGIKNVTIKGGTYKGDKDTHDYSKRDNENSPGTHEAGYGILAEGAINLTIDGIKAFNFTGDGLCIGATGEAKAPWLFEEDFEPGGIDDNGKLIKDPTKIRTKNIEKTNFNHPIFQTQNTFQFSRPENISKTVPFDVYFYKSDGTFITSVKYQEIDWSLTEVPKGASYFHAVFDTDVYKGIKLEYWIKTISKNVTVKNSEFAFNRRQGITIGGASNVLVTNNDIHDIKGTPPQSGIDVEAGFSPNQKIVIRDNRIYNNKGYNVILYDGRDAIVEDNYLGPNEEKSSIGLAISPPFSGAMVKGNTFDGSSLNVSHDTTIKNNKMIDSTALITGPNVSIDGMRFTDSSLHLKSKVAYGIKASNITMKNNKKGQTTLSIDEQPVHLKDISITGESTLRNLIGEVADGSIFENLRVIGYNSTYGLDMPRGTYNNCVFEAAKGGTAALGISKSGNYIFNNCSFKGNKAILTVANPEANLTLKDSKFESTEKRGYGIALIYVEKANKISIVNNIVDTRRNSDEDFHLIKLGKLGGKASLSEVYSAAVKGNTLYSNFNVAGISTIDAGKDSPAYHIEDNILYNAKLQLKSHDIDFNNKEYEQ
jgi:hypothetical protein